MQLALYLIRPIALTSYNLEQTDEEVYSVFVSYLRGSALSREQYMAVNQSTTDDMMRKNADKINIYGFKPMQIEFVGYDRQGNTDDNEKDDLKKKFTKLNEKAEYWYSRLDEMYSGNITVINNFNRPEINPRIGCRAKFIDAEFYITKSEHSWQYGTTPMINLSLSRGMIYNNEGIMEEGDLGVINNIGRRYRELKVNKKQ